MRNAGFLVEANQTTELNATTYTSILLEKDTGSPPEPLSERIPNSGFELSHIDLVLKSDLTPTTVEAYLTWDSAGKEIAAGKTQTPVKLETIHTVDALKGCAIYLDRIRPSCPRNVVTTEGKLYLWLKVDAAAAAPGGPDVHRARLHWRLIPTRGG